MARDSEQVLSVDEVLALIAANPLEDERGVDISQIKRQLAMAPAERIASLTRAVAELERLKRTQIARA